MIELILWVAAAMLVNGLIFRWLGGFGSAGRAIEGWGTRRARRWARRRLQQRDAA